MSVQRAVSAALEQSICADAGVVAAALARVERMTPVMVNPLTTIRMAASEKRMLNLERLKKCMQNPHFREN